MPIFRRNNCIYATLGIQGAYQTVIYTEQQIPSLFLFSTRSGRLCAHRQEKQLYLCDTWYTRCIPDSDLYRTTNTKFISFLYTFRATMCPSPGETTVYATLAICYSVWLTGMHLAYLVSHKYSCNILRKMCAPSWFYLQYYTEMHGQQNIKAVCLYVRRSACNSSAPTGRLL